MIEKTDNGYKLHRADDETILLSPSEMTEIYKYMDQKYATEDVEEYIDDVKRERISCFCSADSLEKHKEEIIDEYMRSITHERYDLLRDSIECIDYGGD